MGESGTTPRGDRAADRLSDRQRQCLELVAEGYTSKQIARKLDLSPSTVDNHVNTAMERLGLSNRADAARAMREAAKVPPNVPTPQGEEPALPAAHQITAPPVLTEALRLPPVGGPENRLSLGRRYFHVVQIALLGTMAMTAVIMTIAGLVQLFSK